MGKSNIIEINGRRYDARSGEALDGPLPQAAPPQAPAAATPTPAAKPQTASKMRVHEAVKARPHTRRQQRSTTLMRSAVTRPDKSLKRRAKAQSSTDALMDKPEARLRRKASVHRVDDRRLQRASHIAKSQAVSRFSRPHGPAPDQPNPPAQLPARQPKPAEFPLSHLPSPTAPPTQTRSRRTIDELNDLVEHALQQAASHLEPAPAAPKRRLFWRFND